MKSYIAKLIFGMEGNIETNISSPQPKRTNQNMLKMALNPMPQFKLDLINNVNKPKI